jgi:translation initiation factor IF-2
MNHLDKCWNAEQEDPDIAARELENQTKMQFEARERIKMLKESSLSFDDEVE